MNLLIDTALAWVWAPLLLYVTAAGTGLLVERVTGFALPEALLAPVGFCAQVALVIVAYQLGLAAPIIALLALAVAAGGLVVTRTLRRLNPGWAGLAGLGAYLLYMAPVLLTGHWTWTGYNFVNDTSFHLLLADHLAANGVSAPVDPQTTTQQAVTELIGSRYPLGAHGLLSLLPLGTGAPLAALFQPYMSASVALAAMALTSLARYAGFGVRTAAAVALLAVSANLLYQYGLQGAVKETAVVAFLAAAAAVTAVLLTRGARWKGGAVCLAVCLAPTLPVYSAAAIGYLGGALATVGLAVAITRGRSWRLPSRQRLARSVALMTGLIVVVALPFASSTADFAQEAYRNFRVSGGLSTGDLGNLLAPLDPRHMSGIWLVDDYRRALAADVVPLNAVATGLVLLLAAGGLVAELVRRRPAAALFALGPLLVVALAAPLLSPYADAKLFAIASPGVVLLAAVGAAQLVRVRPAPPLMTAALLGGLVLSLVASDALAYRGARVAPTDRMLALEEVADQLDGDQWLVNEWEEFAKYFLREGKVNVANEHFSPNPSELRRDEPLFGYYYDLDEFKLRYLQRFRGVVIRRSPAASRPPANFRLVYENDYYEVWRRGHAPRVVAHLPVGDVTHAATPPDCGPLRRFARATRASERLLVSIPPDFATLETTVQAPVRWRRSPSEALVLLPDSPVTIQGQENEVRGGRYRVWVRGSFGRPVRASVNGEEIGTVADLNSPGQWELAGATTIPAGRPVLRLRRADPDLSPGDAFPGVLGPMIIERDSRSFVREVDPDDVDELCGTPIDWLERVADRGK
ncbi:MAG: hypothetical protein ACR2NA_04295 [Solirubrobacterales bacterium]